MGAILKLQPDDFLRFRFELRKQIPATLTLTNTTNGNIAFKVKTTSPKKYCVRPNTGIVPPSGTVEVQVIMQQHKEWPSDFNNCKDKFLVQSMPVDAATAEALLKQTKEYSAVFDSAAPAGTVTEAKLRVQLTQPAPPPSPVPEEGESSRDDAHAAASPAAFSTPAANLGASGQANTVTREPSTRQLAAETMEKNAAIADRARLQKELRETQAKLEQVQGSSGNRQAVFTLIHLIIVALLAFLIGRLMK